MKANYLKHIFSAALVVAVSLGNVSCINDLDISSIDPQSSSSFDQDAAFVKQYALLGLTGQKGPAGPRSSPAPWQRTGTPKIPGPPCREHCTPDSA